MDLDSSTIMTNNPLVNTTSLHDFMLCWLRGLHAHGKNMLTRRHVNFLIKREVGTAISLF